MVHLASYRARESAIRGWAVLQAEHGDALAGLAPLITEVDLGDRGMFFRLTAGPLRKGAEIEALCTELTSRGLYCKPAT